MCKFINKKEVYKYHDDFYNVKYISIFSIIDKEEETQHTDSYKKENILTFGFELEL